MMRNMVTSLIVHERLTTTDAKAKDLRRIAERIITKAVRVSHLADKSKLSQDERAKLLHARRVVGKFVRPRSVDRNQNEIDVLFKLFDDIGPRLATRPGGYLRITKLPNLRKGDAAPMSIIEFVDRDESVVEEGEESSGEGKKKSLLGGLFGGKKKDE